MREFSTAASRGRPSFRDAHDVQFKLDDDVLTAHVPTTGQVALFIQGGRAGGFRSIESLIEFFDDVLDDNDHRVLQRHLREGIDVELLAEIANYLIGEWSGRPTKQSSVSSPTRNGTGRRSTVKPPAAARTTSRSRSTAGATRSNGGSRKG